jgi:hypothetical protein
MLTKSNPEEAGRLFDQAQENIHKRWQHYQRLASNGSKETHELSPTANS